MIIIHIGVTKGQGNCQDIRIDCFLGNSGYMKVKYIKVLSVATLVFVLLHSVSYLWAVGSDNFKIVKENQKCFTYGFPLRCYFPVTPGGQKAGHKDTMCKLGINWLTTSLLTIAGFSIFGNHRRRKLRKTVESSCR